MSIFLTYITYSRGCFRTGFFVNAVASLEVLALGDKLIPTLVEHRKWRNLLVILSQLD